MLNVKGRVRWLAVLIVAMMFLPQVAGAETAQVTIRSSDDGFKYDPQQISIGPGEAVSWKVDAAGCHTVSALDGSFDSSPKTKPHAECGSAADALETGARFSYKFTKAGTFAYSCRIHGFRGVVVVAGKEGSPSPNSPQSPFEVEGSSEETSPGNGDTESPRLTEEASQPKGSSDGGSAETEGASEDSQVSSAIPAAVTAVVAYFSQVASVVSHAKSVPASGGERARPNSPGSSVTFQTV